jgi:hypothetical protein
VRPFAQARLASALLIICVSAGCGASAHEPSVPDVGEPFDFKTFEAFSLLAAENADSQYLLAQPLLVKLNWNAAAAAQTEATETSVRQAALVGWSEANADARKWLEANQKALEVWEWGTTQAEAVEVPLNEFACESLLPVSNEGRTFARLALLKASRRTGEGHPADAWRWYLATLRYSRHLGMHGGSIERMVGTEVYRLARHPILNWAARPEVSAADLRHALADVLAVDAMTAPLSRTLKVEYLSVRHSIPRVLDNLGKEHSFDAFSTRHSGRPEKIVRVANLYFANWLANAERPRWERKPMAGKDVGLFEPDPGSAPLPSADVLKQLLATRLSGLEQSTGPIVDYSLPGMMSLFETVDLDRVNRDAVSVGLALQLYFREHGHFPAALPELVQAGYLKSIPPDPFGKGEPLHYRLIGKSTDRAIVWSVGPDGVNQAGELPADTSDSRTRPETVFEIKGVAKSHGGK